MDIIIDEKDSDFIYFLFRNGLISSSIILYYKASIDYLKYRKDNCHKTAMKLAAREHNIGRHTMRKAYKLFIKD